LSLADEFDFPTPLTTEVAMYWAIYWPTSVVSDVIATAVAPFSVRVVFARWIVGRVMKLSTSYTYWAQCVV